MGNPNPSSLTRVAQVMAPKKRTVGQLTLKSRLKVDDLEVVIRPNSRARRVTLAVKPTGELVVTAPKWLLITELEDIVQSKADWARRSIQDATEKRRAEPAVPDVLDVRMLGIRFNIVYLSSQRSTTRLRQTSANQLTVLHPNGDTSSVGSALTLWLRRYVAPSLCILTRDLASQNGLTVSQTTVRSQRTRWGSCSREGNISLNVRLALLPPDLVRYVILHELTHLEYLNHSQKFWRALERRVDDLPGLKQRLKLANAYLPPWLT